MLPPFLGAVNKSSTKPPWGLAASSFFGAEDAAGAVATGALGVGVPKKESSSLVSSKTPFFLGTARVSTCLGAGFVSKKKCEFGFLLSSIIITRCYSHLLTL